LRDEIRKYIQQLTGAKENVPPPSNYTSNTSSNKAAEEMNKRMSKIEDLLTTLTFANNRNRGGGGNDDKNRGGGGDDKDADKDKRRNRRDRAPMQLYRNMGGYCHSCGFCPVGKEHTSVTCHQKHATHDDNATWTNWGTNGSMVWPSRVRDDQKNHESWAGKSAPTDRGMYNSINIKDYTLDNFYSCLSPPPGQVEEPEQQTIIRSAPQDCQILGGRGQ
jgi:hypothetical protein